MFSDVLVAPCTCCICNLVQPCIFVSPSTSSDVFCIVVHSLPVLALALLLTMCVVCLCLVSTSLFLPLATTSTSSKLWQTLLTWSGICWVTWSSRMKSGCSPFPSAISECLSTCLVSTSLLVDGSGLWRESGWWVRTRSFLYF